MPMSPTPDDGIACHTGLRDALCAQGRTDDAPPRHHNWTPLFILARDQGRYGPPGLASPVDESLELLGVALAVDVDLRSGGVDVA
jgi:hypothetical protein